jgi:antitoxin VapB
MTTTKLFKSNQTQAVRLPKDVAFPDDVREVEIIKVGNSRIISPVGHRWDSFFARTPKVSDDFMVERDQGIAEERLSFDDDLEPR